MAARKRNKKPPIIPPVGPRKRSTYYLTPYNKGCLESLAAIRGSTINSQLNVVLEDAFVSRRYRDIFRLQTPIGQE